ncbi:MAG: hypothetical protein ACYSSO_08315 [Planctomycetota bacterium]|jgi:hypothetical protein
MPEVEVVHLDLPPTEATEATIKKFINNTLGNEGKLISTTVCEGPNAGLQRLIVVYTLE